MEITLLEDPACGWCWAFQPVTTALSFELLHGARKPALKLRRVMGGLRDSPVVEASFLTRHWQTAAQLSGMPFNPAIWERHLLRTTFECCRVVKAATAQGQRAADRFLRRIREAFHVEAVPIDERGALLQIAGELGLDIEALRESLQSGRADFLFQRDRHEAAEFRFGFPSLLLKRHPSDPPTVLNGMVSYADLLSALSCLGLAAGERRRFCDCAEDWDRLFAIHPRLSLAEIRLVTRLEGEDLKESLERNGIRAEGTFYVSERGGKTFGAAHGLVG